MASRGRSILAGVSVSVRLPRAADNAEPFESGLLPRYQGNSPAVLATLPQLYLYGISTGDFEMALECVLGVGAALSLATVARLKQQWVVSGYVVLHTGDVVR